MTSALNRYALAALLSFGALAAACGSPGQDSAPTAAQPGATVKHMNAQDAYAYLQSTKNVTVLDIRTPEEYAAGHIDGAALINFKSADFSENISKLDKSAPYIVHCRSGGRSTKSLKILKAQGFTNITHLDGGIKGWEAANLPLTE